MAFRMLVLLGSQLCGIIKKRLVSTMSEEAKKDTVTEFPYRVASPEFFFLLQRIDRLDEKLTARIDEVDKKLTARIDEVDKKLTARIDQVQESLRQEFRAIKPLIWATVGIVLAALAISVSVAIKIW
jgi:tetrahydromethanopterin S-methyltransferase subunit G